MHATPATEPRSGAVAFREARQRLGALDVLRAIAILLVIGRHLPTLPPGFPWLVAGVLNAWRHVGWAGVDLFFVLSGFLVSGLIFRDLELHGSFSLKTFLIRRGLKIYPGFYVFLLLALPTVLWIPGLVTPTSLLSEAFFVQNYGPSIFPHTWSLAIEEHFYLLLALTLWFATRRRTLPLRKVMWACGACCLLVILFRVLTIHAGPFSLKRSLYPTHLRLDALAFGVLLCALHLTLRGKITQFVRRHTLFLATGSAVLISPALIVGYENSWVYTLGLTCMDVGFGGALLVALAVQSAPRSETLAGLGSKMGRALASVGRYSYSIYLWHIPVKMSVFFVPKRFFSLPFSFAGAFVWYAAGSILVGILMGRLVEMPLLRWRDRKFPSRSGAGETQGATGPHVHASTLPDSMSRKSAAGSLRQGAGASAESSTADEIPRT